MLICDDGRKLVANGWQMRVPFINILFQHAMLFLLDLVLVMKFRRLFGYRLELK